jgi:hypothetical protein
MTVMYNEQVNDSLSYYVIILTKALSCACEIEDSQRADRELLSTLMCHFDVKFNAFQLQ